MVYVCELITLAIRKLQDTSGDDFLLISDGVNRWLKKMPGYDEETGERLPGKPVEVTPHLPPFELLQWLHAQQKLVNAARGQAGRQAAEERKRARGQTSAG